jgi:Family of unknown function (DUF6152)
MSNPSLATLLALLLAIAPGASAHHSYAPYDAVQVRSLTGTVKNFQWSNPHVTFGFWVTPEGGGDAQEWTLITSSPAILKHFGWRSDSVKRGDRIRVECNPMSDGSHAARLHTLYLLDSGRVLETKLSAGVGPSP